MVKRKVLVVSIPKDDIVKEFGWFFQNWGEEAVKTYIVKNPQIIADGLTLVGVGELCHWSQKKRKMLRLDMIFRKDKTYYVVEAKSCRKYAFKQLLEEVASFESDMKYNKEPYEEIIPVLVIVDDELKEGKTYWTEVEYNNN